MVVTKALSTLGLGAEAGLPEAKQKFRALAGKVRAHMVQEKAPKGGAPANEVLEGVCRAYEIVKRRDDAVAVLKYACQPRSPGWAETYQSLELKGAEHVADWMAQNRLNVETLEDLSEEAQLNALLDLGMSQPDAEEVCAKLRGVRRGERGGLEEWLRQRGLGKLAMSLEAAGIYSISRLRDTSAEDLQKCIMLVGPRRKLLEAIRKELGGDDSLSGDRNFSGAVAKRGTEPGSIVVTSGNVTLELGKQGQLSALQGGVKSLQGQGAHGVKAGGGQRKNASAATDEEHLAAVAQLVGSVKRETKLGEELRTREVQWRRRVEVVENAAREAERRLAAADKENAALVEALEKRGQASADRYHDKEMECAKLAGQVSSLEGQLETLKRLAGHPNVEGDASGAKVAQRELQMEILDLKTALANTRKDLSLERSVTSTLQERLESISAELLSERARRKTAEEGRADMDDSMVRLQRLEDERKQWSAQVEQLMSDLYAASVSEKKIKIALEKMPMETIEAVERLKEATEENKRIQDELATAKIIEQRYWSDFLAEPSLAQIEAAARPKTEGGDSPQKSPRTGDADLDLVKEANSELNVSGTVLFASELCRQSEAGSTDQFIAPDDASETSQHYSHVRMSSFRARSSGDDADFETKETRKVKRAGQSSSSDSDEEIVFEERGSPSAVRRGPPRRAGDRPMRGALQRAQKHVLGVWSASPRGSSPR